MSKRARVFPVVGLIGPRQVGKTTFLMHEWTQKQSAQYVTLDKSEVVSRAKREPENFILSQSNNLKKKLIIDEAQKEPTLFDSIKAIIDENRRVGAITLSGSVEFSNKAGVRESLAGRMGLCRLYPLTLSELSKQQLLTPWVSKFNSTKTPRTSKEIDTWLKRGGMPIFCTLHDDIERNMAIQSWLEAICYRDILQFKNHKFDGWAAHQILSSIAREPRINHSQISDEIGISRLDVPKYLDALESLFLIHRLPCYNMRRSSPEYEIFDCALFQFLRGNTEDVDSRCRLMRILAINEILAQFEYSGQQKPQIFFNENRGSSRVDLVIQNSSNRLTAVEIKASSAINPYSLRGIKNFIKQHKSSTGIVLAPVTSPSRLEANLHLMPWTFVG